MFDKELFLKITSLEIDVTTKNKLEKNALTKKIVFSFDQPVKITIIKYNGKLSENSAKLIAAALIFCNALFERIIVNALSKPAERP